MANPRFAWGIDIGNRALKAVKVVRDGDTLRVDDFEFIEHETILSQAGDNRESLIQTALASFVQRHSFKGGVVSIGVSGQNSFARFVKLPPVDEKKIPEIVRFEAIQQIPFPLEDVEWSYQLFRQQDNPEVEVGIFAMRRELVNQHIKYFTDFDLNVQNVQMNPLAVYNAMQFDNRFGDGVAMVVDVGTDNTDLLIASNDSIWMRSIPIGGSNFTEALTKAFKINFVKAEDLKRNAATSKYARQIFQHMRPVFADLVAEIQRSIGFYASVNREVKISKIFALGGTFKLPGLQKYLQQNLQLPVERIDSFSAGAPADPKHAAIFGDNLLSIVSAYGLALQAMNATTVTSSLLPAAIQRERMWQEKTKWFGLAAALFIGGATVVGARWFLEDLQYTNAQSQRSANDQVLKQASSLSKEWESIQNSGESERTIISNLQMLTEGKYFWRDMISEMVAVLPKAQPALQTALDKSDAAAIKLIARGDRRIIRVDEITQSYDPMLMQHLADPNYRLGDGLTAGAPTPPFAPGQNGEATAAPLVDPTGKGRGFVVLMKFTCPLTNATQFVEQEVEKNLLSIQPDPRRPNLKYAVRKVRYINGEQIYKNPTRMQRLQAEYDAAQKTRAGAITTPGIAPQLGRPGGGFGGNRPFGNPDDEFGPGPGGGFGGGFGGGGFGGGFGGGGAGSKPVDNSASNNPAFKDRLTDESMLNDWEFTLSIAVEIDPESYKKPELPADGSVSSAK